MAVLLQQISSGVISTKFPLQIVILSVTLIADSEKSVHCSGVKVIAINVYCYVLVTRRGVCVDNQIC
jgi:hypothetical protein